MVFQCLAFNAYAPIDLMFTQVSSIPQCLWIRRQLQSHQTTLSREWELYQCLYPLSCLLFPFGQVYAGPREKGDSTFYLDKEQPILLFLAFDQRSEPRESGLALGLDMGALA